MFFIKNYYNFVQIVLFSDIFIESNAKLNKFYRILTRKMNEQCSNEHASCLVRIQSIQQIV